MTVILTVRDLNTYRSQIWGDFDESDFMPIIEDLVATVDTLPTNVYESLVADIEERIAKHEDRLGRAANYLHDGNFRIFLEGTAFLEERQVYIGKLSRRLIELWELQSLATKAENSVEDLQVHISKHLKRNDASGAPTPLGQDFEMILEAAQTAVGTWRAESENSPLAEIKTDLVG